MPADAAHLARNVPREVAIRGELEVTLVACVVVDDVHLAVVVNPQPTDDDIVDRRSHLAPCVMVAAVLECAMGDT